MNPKLFNVATIHMDGSREQFTLEGSKRALVNDLVKENKKCKKKRGGGEEKPSTVKVMSTKKSLFFVSLYSHN